MALRFRVGFRLRYQMLVTPSLTVPAPGSRAWRAHPYIFFTCFVFAELTNVVLINSYADHVYFPLRLLIWLFTITQRNISFSRSYAGISLRCFLRSWSSSHNARLATYFIPYTVRSHLTLTQVVKCSTLEAFFYHQPSCGQILHIFRHSNLRSSSSKIRYTTS